MGPLRNCTHVSMHTQPHVATACVWQHSYTSTQQAQLPPHPVHRSKGHREQEEEGKYSGLIWFTV